MPEACEPSCQASSQCGSARTAGYDLPVVQNDSRVLALMRLSRRIWYPTVPPTRSSLSLATRSATATALKAREGGVEAMHVNEGALLTTLSQLLQIADQYQDCLAIGQDSLRTLVEQVRALDPGHVVIKQYEGMHRQNEESEGPLNFL